MMRAVVVGILALPLAGCGSSGRGVADDDVAYKAPAIKQAVDGRRDTAVPELVAGLDDEDSAVRFYAIEGLRRLTGLTFDYHYFDEAPARRPAVEQWRAWLKTRDARAGEPKEPR